MMDGQLAFNPLKILLIEDSLGDAILIEKILKRALPEEYILHKATTIAEALKILSENQFDVALLDRTLPDAREFSGLHSIQNISPNMAIIFLTGYSDEESAFQAIKQGAQDYLFKDHLDEHVIKRSIQFAVLRKEFEEILITHANFDMLTGLANRMFFENRLDVAITKMKLLGSVFSVLLMDLDKFKEVNDTLGHIAGDKLLKEIGYRLQHTLRSYDVVARFGGDEFAILLEDLSYIEQSQNAAQDIINSLKAPFYIADKELYMNISIGIINCYNNREMTREDLLLCVDSAMYEAKSVSTSAYRIYVKP